jgi:Fe-S cluster assembly iron-binding protein IscA
MEKLMSKPFEMFLRLEIFAGEGCEGYTYKFKFDDAVDEENDLIKSITVQSP